MRYTVTKQRVEVIGQLWWPMGPTFAQTRDLSAYDLENIGDPAKRYDVACWIDMNFGDFSSITDFRADFHVKEQHIVHEWRHGEDSEMAFNDAMFRTDDD